MKIWPYFFICGGFLAGCSNEEPPAVLVQQSVPSIQVSIFDEPKTPAPLYPQLDARADVEKWNSYVDLGNEIEIGFYRGLDSYFAAFGNAPDYRAPAEDALVENFLESLAEPEPLARAIERALILSSQEPKSELDQAVGEVSGHLRSLWEGLVQSRDFHAAKLRAAADPEAEALSEEQEKLAWRLHAKIYTAHQGLNATYGRFREVLNRADAERRKRDIRELGERGLVIRPAMLTTIDRAQAMQDLLSSQSITSGSLEALDIDVFTPLFEEFIQSVDDFESRAADGQQPARERLNAKTLLGFGQQLMVVRASATSLMARHQLKAQAEPFPEEVPGTPEHFARELGDLVDLYNSAGTDRR